MARKASPKAQKKTSEGRKPAERSAKIAKKQEPKARAAKANPKQQRGKAQRGQSLKFYTVAEDAQIMEALRKADGKTTKSQLAKDLAQALGRTPESVRDRVKRYIAKLSAADAKEIQRIAKKSPEHFAYFKGSADNRRLEKVAAEQPLIYNRELARKPRISKKVKKPASNRRVDFSWLLCKINASDPYFAIDHSVHLLNSVFARLMETSVSRHEIEQFIHAREGEVTLFEILANFVKRDVKAKSK